jgi:hypothetical protein
LTWVLWTKPSGKGNLDSFGLERHNAPRFGDIAQLVRAQHS